MKLLSDEDEKRLRKLHGSDGHRGRDSCVVCQALETITALREEVAELTDELNDARVDLVNGASEWAGKLLSDIAQAVRGGQGLGPWVEDIPDEVRKLFDRAKELDSFEEEWVCPECMSYDVRELHYEDDLSSMACNDCDYAGEPGEDFPSVRRVRVDMEALRATVTELRLVQKLIEQLTDPETHWLTILGRNPNFDGPAYSIEVHDVEESGERVRRFDGKTLLNCLQKAVEGS